MMSVVIAGALLLTIFGCGAALIVMRHAAYRRRVPYDPRQDHALGMAGPGIETVGMESCEQGFALPAAARGAVSAFLEVDVHATVGGTFAEPAIEISSGNFRDVQYLERGAHGVRFLNVSRLIASKNPAGDKVSLSGHGIAVQRERARLHLCRENVAASDRVLVVAPHPDDAEIAAFGLYADTEATVVTLTAGDTSDRYQNPAQPWLALTRRAVGDIRVWDSVSIPQVGGVPRERVANLCFPDGQLAAMRQHPDQDFDAGDAALGFKGLRRLYLSALLRESTTCTWNSLVGELAAIIADTKPTIVAAPHPRLDPHPDHFFSTIALCDAIDMVHPAGGRFFFYTVHNRRSELWPFGPAGSGVAMLPIFPEDGTCEAGFYSHPLSVERQRQKFLALESMHDLREMQWPNDSTRQAGARLMAELRALAHGMGIVPTSYLRRAVRPDELFFVMSFTEGSALARREAERLASTRAAA
jgi:LmbE family N-acetylglucosaminyl deacetylase